MYHERQFNILKNYNVGAPRYNNFNIDFIVNQAL